MLRTVLTAAGISRITLVDEPRRALDMLCSEPFDAVFVEGGSQLDGMSFAQAARRMPVLLNPMIPIFVVLWRGPPPRCRKGTRRRHHRCDLPSHESQDRNAKNCVPRCAAPRPFIAAPAFFGPDRRAKERPWRGEDRRILHAEKNQSHT